MKAILCRWLDQTHQSWRFCKGCTSNFFVLNFPSYWFKLTWKIMYSNFVLQFHGSSFVQQKPKVYLYLKLRAANARVSVHATLMHRFSGCFTVRGLPLLGNSLEFYFGPRLQISLGDGIHLMNKLRSVSCTMAPPGLLRETDCAPSMQPP